ncbi:NADH-quinone oxidoreductase subunit C [Streptomyces sp. A1277]|uniref:NADH-quinone oxidoreductase subunit C n=1 Tax=Streptomyces sp. A1277 TaxID=2563103 RepID=UPI0010A266B9|nr:NADH-quinone oxidoreductase subunit C [Streptomyces sp. A1277]THA32489.1 NADH-quinone oxidoreductase subunit C [Streptomyces sp. A1277]
MTASDAYDGLPGSVTELFGDDAAAEQAYDLLTVDVPPASWITALETARDGLGCTYFDWLSAVDEQGTGFRVCAHVAALPEPGSGVRRLLLRTTVPHEAPVLPTAIGVYAGAAWHERETHEMFGIGFEGHPHLVPLLLPEGFEGHPLRKDFVLAARVAKAWPGAKEPGESEHGGPKRRTMLPPGVPDPNEWGPLKGQLPPAPTRPARTARAAGDRPPRRTRTAGEATPTTPTTPGASGASEASGVAEQGGAPAAPPRRSRTAGEATPSSPAAPPRRSRSASQGSASQRGAGASETPEAPQAPQAPQAPEAPQASGAGAETPEAPKIPGAGAGAGAGAEAGAVPDTASDAPWHNARPAFDESPEAGDASQPPSQPLRRLRSGGPGAEPPVREGAGRGEAQRSEPPSAPAPDTAPDTAPAPPTAPAPDTEPNTRSAPDPAPAPDTNSATDDTPTGGDPE